MAAPDLRAWLASVAAAGELRHVEGADWNLEIGAISELNYLQRGPALLFDRIPGYPAGHRVLTGAAASPRRLGLTLGMGPDQTTASLVAALRGRPHAWEAAAREFAPRVVATGPVMECVQRGAEVDLLRLPAPCWHAGDGGRYLGTGTAVVTRDPDEGWVNLGADRCMLIDAQRLTVVIGAGKHGNLQVRKWFKRGEPAPVAISLGHHPLLYVVAGTEVPTGVGEYDYAGAILGEPFEVLVAPVTGLPVPAAAEVVVEGFLHRDRRASEGPFGEWTGYYSSERDPSLCLTVEAVYHRRDPILLGAPPGLPPHDYSYWRCALKSAMIHDALVQAGVPEVRGVWSHECGGGRQFVVVSIGTRYCGHARQAGLLASQVRAACYMGKFVVVVDEDIDAANLEQVMWAVCTRCDPERGIEILRQTWGSGADPLLVPGAPPYNSRAVIDATVPFERRSVFPRTARSSAAELAAVRAKWSVLFDRPAAGGEG